MRLPLPSDALYPIRVLALAALIYGVATVLFGLGFLAVLLAGILVGDVRAPYNGRSSMSRRARWRRSGRSRCSG